MIKDNGWGVKKVEVEQAGAFRFLVFTGTIFTRLFVSENRRDHTVEFKLAEKGFMKVAICSYTSRVVAQETICIDSHRNSQRAMARQIVTI